MAEEIKDFTPDHLPETEMIIEEIPGLTNDKIDANYQIRNISDSQTKFKQLYTIKSASTGDFAISGVGFKPKMVRIQAHDNGTYDHWSDGTAVDGDSGNVMYYDNSSNTIKDDNAKILFTVLDGSNTMAATLKSMDSDGCTLDFTTSIGNSINMIYTFYG